MEYLKTNVFAKVDVRALTNFLALGVTASVLPFFIHIQWLTGPIVNAILILTLFLAGTRAAMVVCLVPSIAALVGGLLPAVLAPIVPFIMVSNVIFVLTVDYFYNYSKNTFNGYFLGIFIGGFLKFLFLFANTALIIKVLMKQELAGKVVQLMSLPQFYTAAVGGMIAFIILKWLKRI